MIEYIVPLLLSAVLMAENTPNLEEQLKAVDAEQADMFSDFSKIKKRLDSMDQKASEEVWEA